MEILVSLLALFAWGLVLVACMSKLQDRRRP